jgi:hypothetical protein
MTSVESLSSEHIQRFINEGFVCIPDAFSQATADACAEILWKDSGCDPGDSETWKKPVIRLGEYSQAPFREAVCSSRLTQAFDQLCGINSWLPRKSLGSFVLRFPHLQVANDTGWHVDASFPGEVPDDFLQWRINVFTKGRALLMLFLFSDVGFDDAPTRIAEGSHLQVARVLQPYGEKGLSFIELAQEMESYVPSKIALATGSKGTVYLCHPFLLHAAQDHRGTNPRFLAQPPLLPAGDPPLKTPLSPVFQAIHSALAL